MQKSTRIQTNDGFFRIHFAQRSVGHDYDHATIEGGRVTRDTAFYPKKCQRAVQLLKQSDEITPKTVLKKFEEAREADDALHHCLDCNSINMTSI